MTTSRQFADSDGDFQGWQDHAKPCHRLMPATVEAEGGTMQLLNHEQPCGAAVKVRSWESSDGAYEDYQYRCAAGHVWWIDGIDS